MKLKPRKVKRDKPRPSHNLAKMWLDKSAKCKPSEPIVSYAAHIEWDSTTKEFVGAFYVDGMRFVYGRDRKQGWIKDRMRKAGWTQFVDEGHRRIKLIPRIRKSGTG